jgi:hypothetical protein
MTMPTNYRSAAPQYLSEDMIRNILKKVVIQKLCSGGLATREAKKVSFAPKRKRKKFKQS